MSADVAHVRACVGGWVSQHLEAVIKSKIPGISSIINSNIEELEKEMDTLGRPVGGDQGVGIETLHLKP